jgi:hypothetical protein
VTLEREDRWAIEDIREVKGRLVPKVQKDHLARVVNTKVSMETKVNTESVERKVRKVSVVNMARGVRKDSRERKV